MEVFEPRQRQDEVFGAGGDGHGPPADGRRGVGVVGGHEQPQGAQGLLGFGLANAVAHEIDHAEQVVTAEQTWVCEQYMSVLCEQKVALGCDGVAHHSHQA